MLLSTMKVYKIHHSIYYQPFYTTLAILIRKKILKQSLMPTIGTRLDPFECLTNSARSCNKSIHERIHLVTNAFVDDFCIVTRHSGVGMAHHLTHDL